MERNKISGLEKNRSMFFNIGLILSISAALCAFNWTFYDVQESETFVVENPIEDEILNVPQTMHKKKLPPPVIEMKKEIIEDLPDVEFREDPLPEKTETLADKTPDIIPDVIPAPVAPKVEKIIPPKPPVLPKEPEEKGPDFFTVVEEMPRFGDCDDLSKAERKACSDRAIMQYFGKNIKYPRLAVENGIEGIVVLRFMIDEKGDISDVEIVKEIGGGCGKEAIRVVKSMPSWTAGLQRGRAVKVQFNLPVKFRLK